MKTSIEIEYLPSNTVEIQNGSGVSVDISNQDPVSIEVSLVNSGPAGPEGPKGDKGDPGDANSIGGFPVVISDPSTYDVIAFVSGSFVNRPQTDITDGGNY